MSRPRTQRIVFVNPTGELGGSERNVVDVLTGLRAELTRDTLARDTLARDTLARDTLARDTLARAELHLIVWDEGPLESAAAALGVRVHRVHVPEAVAGLGDAAVRGVAGLARLALRALSAGPAGLAFLAALRAKLAQLRPTLIQSNGIKCHLAVAATAPPSVPLVWFVQDFLGARRLAGPLLRLAGRRTDSAVCISAALADDLARMLPRLPAKVIHSAVDTESFAPDGPSADLDAAAGLPPAPPGTVRVGLAATYARWKGQEVFLAAAAELARLRPERSLRFYVVGGPIYRTIGSQWSVAELRERIAALGLSERVGLVGFRPDMPTVYRALDVAVHASTQPEPFGRTIVEAMACGRAVIVSAAGGAAELFTEGRDALGVAPGDVSGLAVAMDRLSGDMTLRARLGGEARRTAAQRFDRRRLGPQTAAWFLDRVAAAR